MNSKKVILFLLIGAPLIATTVQSESVKAGWLDRVRDLGCAGITGALALSAPVLPELSKAYLEHTDTSTKYWAYGVPLIFGASTAVATLCAAKAVSSHGLTWAEILRSKKTALIKYMLAAAAVGFSGYKLSGVNGLCPPSTTLTDSGVNTEALTGWLGDLCEPATLGLASATVVPGTLAYQYLQEILS